MMRGYRKRDQFFRIGRVIPILVTGALLLITVPLSSAPDSGKEWRPDKGELKRVVESLPLYLQYELMQSRQIFQNSHPIVKYSLFRVLADYNSLDAKDKKALESLITNVSYLPEDVLKGAEDKLIAHLVQDGYSKNNPPQPLMVITDLSDLIQDRIADRAESGHKAVLIVWGEDEDLASDKLIPITKENTPFTYKFIKDGKYVSEVRLSGKNPLDNLHQELLFTRSQLKKVASLEPAEGDTWAVLGGEGLRAVPTEWTVISTERLHQEMENLPAESKQKIEEAIQADFNREAMVDLTPEELGLNSIYKDDAPIRLVHLLITRERGVKTLGNNFVQIAAQKVSRSEAPGFLIVRFAPSLEPQFTFRTKGRKGRLVDGALLQGYLMDADKFTQSLYLDIKKNPFYQSGFSFIVVNEYGGDAVVLQAGPSVRGEAKGG